MNKIQISNMFGWIFLLLGLWQHPLIFVADGIFFVNLIACLVWAYHEQKRARERRAQVTHITTLPPPASVKPVSLEKEDQEEK